jgi:hypothetical protein
MKRAKPKQQGRGPPALRIHAGVSRPPCLDQGPHCRPLDPASLSLFAGAISHWTLNHGRCDARILLHDYS